MSKGVETLLQQRTELDAELRKHKSPVTVMFTDLAGSTSYFERHGDTVGLAWLEKHNGIVIPTVTRNNGVVVKTIGDSVMAYFVDVVDAGRAAREIQQKLLEANKTAAPDARMHVRVAMHQGLGYLRGGDVFGDVVNVAARLAKLCLPAQVIMSEAVHLPLEQAQSGDFEFAPLGTQQLRGKSSTESIYEMLWTDADTYAELRQKFPPKDTGTHGTQGVSEGRYQILGELGRGAMGVVYKAYDKEIGRTVAMKTIPLEVPPEERDALVDRLRQEARTAGCLDHPNVITIFDVGEEGGLFYVTMQYVQGETLSDILAKKNLLSVMSVVELMDQVCSGVGFAHQAGIIHRDLKPSNLMITKQGNAKVLDFGIAKLGDAGLTRAGMIVGTPSYLSPEQAAGRRLDQRSDIFALGAVLYEALTGERAFPGESTTSIIYKVMNEDPVPVSAIEPTLPLELDAITRKALAKDPNRRFQTCEDMCRALKAAKESQKASMTGRVKPLDIPLPEEAAAKPGSSATLAMPPPSGSKKTLWIAGGAVAALVAVGAVAVPMMRKPQPSQPARSEVSSPAATAPASQPVSAPVPAEGPGVSPLVSIPVPATETAKPAKSAAKKPQRAPELQPRASLANTAPPPAAPAPRQEASAPQNTSAGYADVPQLLRLADTYAGRGDYSKAVNLYKQVLAVDPKNSAALDGLERARLAQGQRK
jgi:eukaryotic-like serine/threonine-protein kinase